MKYFTNAGAAAMGKHLHAILPALLGLLLFSACTNNPTTETAPPEGRPEPTMPETGDTNPAGQATDAFCVQLLELVQASGYELCSSAGGRIETVEAPAALAMLQSSGQLESGHELMAMATTVLQNATNTSVLGTFEVAHRESGEMQALQLVYVPFTEEMQTAEAARGKTGLVINTLVPAGKPCVECFQEHGEETDFYNCNCLWYTYCLRDGETCKASECAKCPQVKPGKGLASLCPEGLPMQTDPSVNPQPLPEVAPGVVLMEW